MKKYKEEWWGGKGAYKGAGKGRAWLGAGLLWKRILATSTGTRKPQRTAMAENCLCLPMLLLQKNGKPNTLSDLQAQ